ncbi:MAG: sce7725 family protein [Candidatus Cloacimonetes bacterium]|nr:sce7725 family protein [Candidatus Cloacimonadota bacterium]
MYYPYLRGRQFELIALREFALQRGDNNNIIPIIEPVKKTFNSMKLAIPKLIEGDVLFALILNPQVGEIKDNNNIVDELNDKLTDSSKWIPAFIVTSNYNEIITLIDQYEEVMLVCSDIIDSSNVDFEQLIFSPKVKYIVSKENRTLKRKLSVYDKLLIRLDDNFKAQKRNKDYLQIPEEKFSEEHMFYEEDRYSGFADYTILESDFKEGGAAPYAVAIHLSFQKTNREIWVRHFTSTTNDDRTNIQGKFAEAAEKAITFLDEKHIANNATNELRTYYDEKKYPGLGMIKKISIKNHLELVNEIITNTD